MSNNSYKITLECSKCDNIQCRIGDFILPSKKQGCVREVSEDLYIQYYHFINEVWDFCKKDKYYEQVMQVLDKVYKSKIVNKNGDGFVPKQLIDNSEKNMV